jgi:hypothetical protein
MQRIFTEYISFIGRKHNADKYGWFHACYEKTSDPVIWACRIPSTSTAHPKNVSKSDHGYSNLKRHLATWHRELYTKVLNFEAEAASTEELKKLIDDERKRHETGTLRSLMIKAREQISLSSDKASRARVHYFLFQVSHGVSFNSVESFHFNQFIDCIGKNRTTLIGSRKQSSQELLPLLHFYLIKSVC